MKIGGKIALGICASGVCLTLFYMSTGYLNKENTVTAFVGTTDGSAFRKYMTVYMNPDEHKPDESGGANEAQKESTVGDTTPTVVTAVTETPGIPQGLWCDANGNTISPEQFLEYTRAAYGDYAQTFIDCFGIGMYPTNSNPVSLEVDKYRDMYGEPGTIHYSQSGQPWGSVAANVVRGGGLGKPTIGDSACGYTGLSIIFSTLLRRYITPAEVIAARDNHHLRFGNGDRLEQMCSHGGAGAMVQSSTRVCDFVSDLRYNGKPVLQCSMGRLNQENIDKTLDAGGMVLFVAHSDRQYGVYWTGGGHYVVIREKRDGLYYTADGSHDYTGTDAPVRHNGDHNVAHEIDVFLNVTHSENNAHFIVPGPGYEEYIKSLK